MDVPTDKLLENIGKNIPVKLKQKKLNKNKKIVILKSAVM